MRWTWKAALVIVVSMAGCQLGRNPLLDIPIAASGATRSPPFRLYSKTIYNFAIGLEPMRVEEAACAAVYLARTGSAPSRPCHEVTPPVAKITWTVTQNGAVIAKGSMDAQPEDLAGNHPSWAKDKNMSWSVFTGAFCQPGDNFILEVNLQPGPIDLSSYHPRIAVIKPL
jgi:hypothetical protein